VNVLSVHIPFFRDLIQGPLQTHTDQCWEEKIKNVAIMAEFFCIQERGPDVEYSQIAF
jgi:hypothetical protein